MLLTFRKSMRKYRFPDEYLASGIESMKTNHPHIIEFVKLIEYGMKGDETEDGQDIPPAPDIVDAIRSTKTYKRYPISLGDENRMFMTMCSYHIRHTYDINNAKSPEQYEDIIMNLIEQDQAIVEKNTI